MRIIYALTLVLVPFCAAAASLHRVQRGETWETVASRYDITADELRRANPRFETLFIGLELNIPSTARTQPRNAEEMRGKALSGILVSQADAEHTAGNYGKARKLYDRAIMAEPSGELFFKRGYNAYMDEKWADAAGDFSEVLGDCDCPTYMRERAGELLASANKNFEIQQQRNAQRLQNVIAGVGIALGTAAVIASATSSSSKSVAPSSSYSGGKSNGSVAASIEHKLNTPGGFNQDFNGIMSYTINQYYQQENEEYQAVRANYLAIGQDITLEQFRMIKAQAWAEANGNGSAGSVSGSFDSSETDTGNYLQRYRKWEQMAESQFGTLTNLGSSHVTSTGDVRGSTGSLGNPGGAQVSMKMNLRDIQKQMRDIRNEAAQHGITIPQSHWETASVR